jgi:hypothetical protein
VSGGSPTGAFRGHIPGRRHPCEEQFQTFHVRRGSKKMMPRCHPCRLGPKRKIRTNRWTQLHVDFSFRFWVGTRPLGTTTSCVGFPFPIRGGPLRRGYCARNVQRDKRCAHTEETPVVLSAQVCATPDRNGRNALANSGRHVGENETSHSPSLLTNPTSQNSNENE